MKIPLIGLNASGLGTEAQKNSECGVRNEKRQKDIRQQAMS